MKEIQDNRKRVKDTLYSQISRINIVKMIIVLKPVYRFIAVLSNTNGIFFFFNRTRKNNFKICMGTQKTPNSQDHPEKEQSWMCHTSLDYTQHISLNFGISSLSGIFFGSVYQVAIIYLCLTVCLEQMLNSVLHFLSFCFSVPFCW